MITVNMIIQIFCLVDDEMKNMPKHSQARIYPGELITFAPLVLPPSMPLPVVVFPTQTNHLR